MKVSPLPQTIDLIGLADDLTFGQLALAQQGNVALIQSGAESLAVLSGVQTDTLTEADFTLV
ncbi:MAG: hypothetical protein AAF152_04110 [Cyanobacteria bacterium P01_A01_bin.114]